MSELRFSRSPIRCGIHRTHAKVPDNNDDDDEDGGDDGDEDDGDYEDDGDVDDDDDDDDDDEDDGDDSDGAHGYHGENVIKVETVVMMKNECGGSDDIEDSDQVDVLEVDKLAATTVAGGLATIRARNARFLEVVHIRGTRVGWAQDALDGNVVALFFVGDESRRAYEHLTRCHEHRRGEHTPCLIPVNENNKL